LAANSNQSTLQKELAQRMSTARESAGVTQVEVAKRMKTTQPFIARLESGRELPSTRTLVRYAVAVGRRLSIKFKDLQVSTQRESND
jgi:transcriptional regulator with XRE-family HTH domain